MVKMVNYLYLKVGDLVHFDSIDNMYLCALQSGVCICVHMYIFMEMGVWFMTPKSYLPRYLCRYLTYRWLNLRTNDILFFMSGTFSEL